MADYKNLIPFVRLKEGGKSSAQTDTAKSNPAPCGNGSNGYPYHTNKGITWLTFYTNANSLGYSATCANFLQMPDFIWEKIYKKIYWDQMKCDKIKNQAIANTFVEWAWGSGVGGATSSLKKFFKDAYKKTFLNIEEIVDFVNELDSENKNSDLFEGLFNWRNGFFTGLNQPANLKGWLNRLDAFYAWNKPFVFSKTSILIGSTIALGVIGIVILGLKLYGKSNK